MKHLIAAGVIFLALPALAQDRMTQVQCSASLTALTELVGAPVALPQPQVDAQGWCALDQIDSEIDAVSSLRIASLRWRASDIDRFINDGLPPRVIEIEGRGMSHVTRTGDVVFDYLFGLQSSQTRMGFGALVRWDGVQNVVSVDSAYFEFGPTNRIEASARIEGANLTDIASMQTSLGTVGLQNLTLKSQFDGWFETYAATILGNMVLQSGDVAPEAQVAALQRQAIEIIDAMPDAFLPDPSRAALAAFVTSLPTPRGSAQLQLSAQPAIDARSLTRFATLPETATPSEVVEVVLDGVTLLFTWTPTGAAQ